MPTRDPLSAHISIDIPGKPLTVVTNIGPEHARIVAALALLPPAVFRAVAGRIDAWKVPDTTFSTDARMALLTLYAAIREAFSE